RDTERDRRDTLARRQRRQQTLTLRQRAGLAQGDRPEHGAREERPGHERLAALLEDDGHVEERAALAAEVRGDEDAEPSELGERAPAGGIVRVRRLHRGARNRGRILRREELPRRVAQHLLLWGEAEVHASPRGGVAPASAGL